METIVCSAIWFDDYKSHPHQPINIKSGYVACGLRHHNCFYTLSLIWPESSYKNYTIQGFLTSNNRFVDRKEALQIALKANQTITNKIELFSEDIWKTNLE